MTNNQGRLSREEIEHRINNAENSKASVLPKASAIAESAASKPTVTNKQTVTNNAEKFKAPGTAKSAANKPTVTNNAEMSLQDFSTEVAFLRPIVGDNKPVKIKPQPDDDPSRASDTAASLTNLTM